MTVFSLVLYLHVVATLGVFTGLGIEWLILFALRRAASETEARTWTELLPRLTPLTVVSSALLILSGIYLAARSALWSQAWIEVSLASVLLMAPLGAFAGRRMRAIGRAMGNDAVLRVTMSCRTAIGLGIVMLMTIKPNRTESIAVIAIAVAGGLAYGLALRNPRAATQEYETGSSGRQ